jgi:dUTP pyrophosphatase
MKFKLLDPVCLPFKAHPQDAGIDLRSRFDTYIPKGQTRTLQTGVCVEVPYGFTGNILPRSSFSKLGVLVHTGVIDNGYQGEISIVMTNLSGERLEIMKGERIAQLVVCQLTRYNNVEVVEEFKQATARGTAGFGSTGRI